MYASGSEDAAVDEEPLMGYGNMEFDFIEVEKLSEGLAKAESDDEKNAAEYEFPLFGGMEARGRTLAPMKVSLREASEERIVNERPQSYYFARYSQNEKRKFESAAVSYEQIIQDSATVVNSGRNLVDLNQYNDQIDRIKSCELVRQRKMRKRPGKKKRENKIVCKRRKEEREIAQRRAEKEELAKIKKKMYHKRGGKKNKKKAVVAPLKYRTE